MNRLRQKTDTVELYKIKLKESLYSQISLGNIGNYD